MQVWLCLEFSGKTLGLEGVIVNLEYSGFFSTLTWLGFRVSSQGCEGLKYQVELS